MIDRVLRVGSGITEDEVAGIRAALDGLSDRLTPLDDGSPEVEIWTRKRGTPDQVVYLAVRAAGGVDVIAQSTEPSFDTAIADVKRRMRRQLADRHGRASEHRRR